MFLDHWKKYIDDGAQTKHWKDQNGAEKYVTAYQRLYRDVTSSSYDSCNEYILATAIWFSDRMSLVFSHRKDGNV